MKTYNSLEDFKVNFKTVVTIGTFDGVHLGHRYIINQLKKIAEREGAESVLLTFSPHPRIVLQDNNDSLKLIDTLEEKKKKLEKIGLDHMIIHKFTKEFSRTKYVNFVRDILIKKLNVDHLVIGYDHHFGRNREGSFDHLTKFGPVYGFEVEEIPPQDVNYIKVSSTKIRNAIMEGDINKATEYMGHPYVIIGVVVKGNQIGRSIGFPTANIKVEEANKLVPREGVYAVRVIIDKKIFFGMLNIGYRPTLSNDNQLSIEVNIFDFKKNIYGEQVSLEIIQHVRNEIQFTSVNDLKSQLEKDLHECKSILKSL